LEEGHNIPTDTDTDFNVEAAVEARSTDFLTKALNLLMVGASTIFSFVSILFD